ncbi:hypothetical protein [Dyadobacter sp. CY356]|uniref:hypothetical protein n=1 Tax=Dyadobacter sp. CY356 TaxID=2906442 RepID=UPI001F1AF58D|nr:hypothetical protein [Dyadobacter sp. CY356]MCF0055827.1 hypothetical protein [Dyadobacter sp. CY356]
MSRFKLKDNPEEQVEITSEQIEEIVPDADFRFSLIILKTEEKFFVVGSKSEICGELGIDE